MATSVSLGHLRGSSIQFLRRPPQALMLIPSLMPRKDLLRKLWSRISLQIVKRVSLYNNDKYISLAGIPMTMHGIGMILHVLEDMLRGFFTDLSASSTNLWTPLQSDEDLKIMAKRAPHYPGSPGGGTIMLSTSVAIPVPPKRVFDFLSDDESRPKVCTIWCNPLEVWHYLSLSLTVGTTENTYSDCCAY